MSNKQKDKAIDSTQEQTQQTYCDELILRAAGEGIYVLDCEGVTSFVNPAASKMLGWEITELIGQPMHSLLHHSKPDGSALLIHQCPIHAAFKDGKVHHVEDEVFWRKDGSSFPVEYTSTPIYKDKKLSGAVVVFNDISERKLIEQTLQNAYLEKELILNAVGEGIYGLNNNGEATFINPAAERMTGWSAKETLGVTIHDKHHHSYADGSHYPREECPIYAAINDGKIHHEDNEVFWRKDGSSFPVEYTSTPIFEEGEICGAVVVFKDITERKKNEQKLIQALAEVERMKEQLEAENDYLKEEIRSEHNFKDIVGKSHAIKQVLGQIELVAPTGATVLVTGESGTGKELIARAIHDRSERNQYPLIKVNCAAIPRELFESEFFGHVKGSFTGALKDRAGRFELASGGTIFLDEVGEIPLELQSKLLRVLQEGEFERVGEEKTRSVDVRIIAATNRDLKQDVEAKRFREDLFFRLNVFPIKAVSLRERLDDIPLLAGHFIRVISARLNRPEPRLTQVNVKQLQSYSWRGNIRELQNVIERAIILCNGKRLQFELPTDSTISETKLAATSMINVSTKKLHTETERMEQDRANITLALKQASGKISGTDGAADLLGIKPTTLTSRMKKLGIKKQIYKH